MTDSAPNQRRSIRLKEYEYTLPGAYFVTVVAWKREEVFGRILNQAPVLNDVGEMVSYQWENLCKRFPQVELDEFIVMPNHFHGILMIVEPDWRRGAGGTFQDARFATEPLRPVLGSDQSAHQGAGVPAKNHRSGKDPLRPYATKVVPGSLGAVIRAFKASTAYR
ncbi:MAG TPA: hypothetical protein VMT46_14875 [Anaerolineaceae bacterium]|nr:hypothetical protein [Anaerolineaceae bacterium]